ncbi:hypothetical protein GALMADRAFT_237962 [Galerina marginata CBS 339.88]|uniref:DUF6534 domain-containing protein n=1 Tax=Galerina marginata (strain CBS 339.88) TaxID=685588 RepID=A0A067TUC7_GALM3|nr:hypothetical protein GALMADRAFT_237962 [Galerina marginata CBS 339.88]
MGPAEIAHGPILIGFTFNAILLGVMMTQVYIYYTSFKRDKIWIKIFVAVLFFFDILNTACDVAYIYEALIIHFGDTAYLNVVTWLFDTDPAITGVIVSSVQTFFAWRIYLLTKNWILPLVIVTTAISGGVTAILTPVEVAKAPFFVYLIRSKVTIIIWLSSEVLGDILITAILVTYLTRRKTGFERSDMLIDKIIRITIQTGLVTAIVATINLLVYLLNPTGLHLLFNFPLAKLYSNSLMSTLNSRGIWMTGRSGLSTGKDAEENTISMNNMNANRAPVPPNMKASDMINLNGIKRAEVYVNVESETQDGLHSVLPLGKGAFDDRGSY